MNLNKTISAQELIRLLIQDSSQLRCLDVRSEDEFKQNTIPSFKNIPVLDNHERHLVGLCYKENGQNEAIKLGHGLVSNRRDNLIENWRKYLSGAEIPVISCWRGGLRSQITCQWLAEVGLQSVRVEGGTKAIRNEFIQELLASPELIVIAGPTGSGKTKLLQRIHPNKVDLEEFAKHRGSAFGRFLNVEQPSQVSFENKIALHFMKVKNHQPLFIEDESKAIGSVYLPRPLLRKIENSSHLRIKMTIEERVENIFQSYVAEPLKDRISPGALLFYFDESLTKIKSKLGGLKESEIRTLMHNSFIEGNLELHREWIRELLIHYYDKAYEYSFNRSAYPIAFEGDWNSCLEWINHQSGSQKL